MIMRVAEVAKYIINHENEMCRPTSNLRLQKLLYFVQVQSILLSDNPCFPEKIEAWNFGPVIPEIYHKYKMFGVADIPTSPETPVIDDNSKYIIDDILEQCAKYTTTQLVAITHNQSPWRNAYKNGTNTQISVGALREYFGVQQ